MKSNFELVAAFNERAGNKRGDKSRVESQMELIEEEYDELFDAVRNGEMSEIRKELCDCLVVLYGLAHTLGIDADGDMMVVNDSNMSKFCDTFEEIESTCSMYHSICVDVIVDYKEGVVRSACDQYDVNGKYYSANKVLKSAYYSPAKF